MTRTALRHLTTGAAGLGIVTLGALAGPTAQADDHEPAGYWMTYGYTYADDGDAGGSSVYTELRWSESPIDFQAAYTADFYAYGEGLFLDDNRTDGQEVMAIVNVEDHQTKVVVGYGYHNLSYPEDKWYSVQVCIEGTGICSDPQYGTT